MKKTILLVALLTSTSANADLLCRGKVNVNNVGLTSTQDATVYLDHSFLVYTGPHASIDLGKTVKLAYKKSGNTYRADASKQTHGGETNLFQVDVASDSLSAKFSYLGTYGYTARGDLQCATASQVQFE